MKQTVDLVVGTVPEAIDVISFALERKRFRVDQMSIHRFKRCNLVFPKRQVRNRDFSGPILLNVLLHSTQSVLSCLDK